MLPCYDPQSRGNSPAYHTGKKCAKRGCNRPAGTVWNEDLCMEHNMERCREIEGGRKR